VDVFNVGQLRRSKARDMVAREGKKADHSANFFSATNDEAKASREKLAQESLESLIHWLRTTDGNVGILGTCQYRRQDALRVVLGIADLGRRNQQHVRAEVSDPLAIFFYALPLPLWPCSLQETATCKVDSALTHVKGQDS